MIKEVHQNLDILHKNILAYLEADNEDAVIVVSGY